MGGSQVAENKEEFLPEPKKSTDYDEIVKVKVDPDADITIVVHTERGDLEYPPFDSLISHPEGDMVIEDFPAGRTTRWCFWHAEFQYILKGTAEMTYTLLPYHDEVKTMIAGPGDAYLVPKGADITWKVLPGDGFRKLCVTMPADPAYRLKGPRRMEIKK